MSRTIVRLFVMFGIFSYGLRAQEAKRPTPGYLSNPLVVKDEGCTEDYVKMVRSSGLKQRKLLADLITFGCVEQFPDAVYEAHARNQKVFHAPNTATVILQEVRFFIDSDLSELALGHKPSCEPWEKCWDGEGWVLDKAFLRLTEHQMFDALTKRTAEKQEPQ